MSLRALVSRVTRLETQRRLETDASPFTFDYRVLRPEEIRIINDALALTADLGDEELNWEALSPDERDLCTRAARIVFKYRYDASDRQPRLH
jgi:hypothetical protein